MAQPTPRSFGEEGARLTYGSYLRLPDLLGAQHRLADPPAHDELLFITVHQIYELWFQQVLHELEAVRSAMFDARLWQARQLLRRVDAIEHVMIEQVAVLETMTPQDFLLFRERLAPASGFQSVQFREVEFLSGAQDPGYLDRFVGITDLERDRLYRRLAEPTLWDGYLHVLAARGLPVAEPQLADSLLQVARDRDRYSAEWDLAEALLTHDANAWLWRSRHVVMVERQIGTRSGTGGSSGGPYLRGRLPLRYFPHLWMLRDQL